MCYAATFSNSNENVSKSQAFPEVNKKPLLLISFTGVILLETTVLRLNKYRDNSIDNKQMYIHVAKEALDNIIAAWSRALFVSFYVVVTVCYAR